MKYSIILLLNLLLSLTVYGQDVYEIRFTYGVTQHRCALVLYEDGTGVMRVRYYNNGTQMVEQYVVLEDTDLGYRIAGYNPVYPDTNTPHPTYKADKFYYSIDEYGNTSIWNVDDQGAVSRASIRKIEGKYYINEFLSDFDWRLD